MRYIVNFKINSFAEGTKICETESQLNKFVRLLYNQKVALVGTRPSKNGRLSYYAKEKAKQYALKISIIPIK